MSIRRKCFISYHKDDAPEVEEFISTFDYLHRIFLSRSINEMEATIVNSNDRDYIMRRIREKYLSDSTVTLVMLGRCTWSRKFVDWEIASSLRDDPINRRNGLIGISLRSVGSDSISLPDRLADNLGIYTNSYARWYDYPTTPADLEDMIEDAFYARYTRSQFIDNRRDLFVYNRSC